MRLINKYIIITSCFLATVVQAMAAEGAGGHGKLQTKPYFGVDLSRNFVSFDGEAKPWFKNRHSSFFLNGGLKIDNKVSVEFFYQRSNQKKERLFGGPVTAQMHFLSKMDYYAFGLDASTYYHFGNKHSVFLGPGIGFFTFDSAQDTVIPSSGVYNRRLGKERHVAVRYVAGTELKVTDFLSFKTAIRYSYFIDYDKYDDRVKSLMDIMFGIRIYF